MASTMADAPSPAPAPVLVVYAHPQPHRSVVNRRMAEAAAGVPGVFLRDLYETYPDFHVDVGAEQALLAAAELLVFQHPVQWYGMPSLLKEWVDVVLEHGWAYGRGGDALRGKHFLLAATTGGAEASYAPGAYHGQPFEAFLPPIRQTAALCGMTWLPPVLMHGARAAGEDAVNAHIDRYRDLLATWPAWRDGAREA